MKSLEDEARIHANLNEGFDYAEESYYQPTKINAYRSFKDGAKSKWVQAEKIKAQIEVIKEIISSGYKFRNTLEESENKLSKLQQQLKELEDESKTD
jgi:hypothetical protein